jgi:hypothetical protein
MSNPNNPSKFNPWIVVSAILAISLAWTLANMYIFVTKSTRLGSTHPEKMWYAVEHSKTELVVDQKDANRLWQLTYNLSVPCLRLDYDRRPCVEEAQQTAKAVLATKHHTYQFRVCTPGIFGESCTRLRPYTAEHIKIFDSLVAIQNKYWDN